MSLVVINKDKCQQSYACVRICPVQAIEFGAEDDFPRVVDERCLACGSCLSVCGQNAVEFQSNLEIVNALLSSGSPAAALLSPEIAAEFGDIRDYRKFVNMIKQLGFAYVNEVSFGVDLVAPKYAELFSDFKGKYYITANCPAIVDFISRYHPALAENLAPIVSPMVAMAKVVRKKYGKNLKIIYITSCLASKLEAANQKEDGRIDAVLTFIELRELFKANNISEATLEYSDFDPPYGNKGAIYPFSEGILEIAGISNKIIEGDVFTAEGRNNAVQYLDSIENQLDQIHHHFNMFYCDGCLNGPGMSGTQPSMLRKSWVIDYAEKRMSLLDLSQWEKDMAAYSTLDLSRKFLPNDQRLPLPSEEKIQSVLKILGKAEDDSLSKCASCGYPSCYDFAVAVAQGLAKTEMCHSFSIKNRQEYIKTLKQTNEKLTRTQEALKDSERMARKEQQLAQVAMETMQALMQKLPTGMVVVDEKLRIQQSNDTFIHTLGKDAEEINEIIPGLKGADLKTLLPYPFYNLFSYVLEKDDDIFNRDVHFGDRILNVSVFVVRKNKLAGAVVRDMYIPEIAKEEVIRRVGEAIEENLEVVQKIAFLLGEGASKTESILNSIIAFHQTDSK